MKRFHPIVFILAIVELAMFAGCRSEQTSSSTEHFFVNSRRRLATAEEQKGIVKVGGCAGFYVRNNQDQALVMTARHCMNYNPDQWCATGSIFDPTTGMSRRCVGVALKNDSHDPVIIQVEGKQPDTTFRLALDAPAAETRLKMLGYPADRYAQVGSLTVSENCWVHSSGLPSPHIGTEYEAKGLLDESFHHNCSTYGGNSGGPMLVEGTDIVVGLPYTYGKDDFGNQPSDSPKGFAASVYDVLRLAHQTAVGLGIERARTDAPSIAGDYLRRGFYAAGSGDLCFEVAPYYLTSARVVEIYVRWRCDQQGDWQKYSCDEAALCSFSGSYIGTVSRDQFFYKGSSGAWTAMVRRGS